MYGFLLVFFSNFVPKMHRFWDIRLQKCRDLENRVRVASRSLEISPCDRAFMTSYWRSIVTMALSRVVSEMFNVEKCRDLEIGVKGHSRSSEPIDPPLLTSYQSSIVTMGLSRTGSEINGDFSRESPIFPPTQGRRLRGDRRGRSPSKVELGDRGAYSPQYFHKCHHKLPQY